MHALAWVGGGIILGGGLWLALRPKVNPASAAGAVTVNQPGRTDVFDTVLGGIKNPFAGFSPDIGRAMRDGTKAGGIAAGAGGAVGGAGGGILGGLLGAGFGGVGAVVGGPVGTVAGSVLGSTFAGLTVGTAAVGVDIVKDFWQFKH